MFLKKYADLPKNVFGMLFWNIFCIYIVIFTVVGLLALFNVRPIEFNGEPTYGIVGLITALLFAPLMALVTAFTTWLLLIAGNFILKTVVRIFGKSQANTL